MIFVSSVFLPLILRLDSGVLPFAERHAVADQFLSLHAQLWPAVLILFLLLSAHSVFVSHRVAGPLVRFRKVVRAVAAGDLSVRFTLRKKDYLVKEAVLVEEMIAALRGKIGRVKERCSDLDALAEEIQADADGGSVDEIRPKIERLRTTAARLAAALGEFNTQAPQDGALATPKEAPSLSHPPVTEA